MRSRRGMGDIPFLDSPLLPDFSDVNESVETTAPSPSVIAQFKGEFNAAVSKLDNAVATLFERRQLLLTYRDYAYSIGEGDVWENELQRADTATSYIESGQSAVATARNWWQNVQAQFGLSGLKAVPLLAPMALIASISVAAIGVIGIAESIGAVLDRWQLQKWEADNAERARQGLPPLPKPRSISSASIFAGATDFGKILIVGFAAAFLLPALLNRRK